MIMLIKSAATGGSLKFEKSAATGGSLKIVFGFLPFYLG